MLREAARVFEADVAARADVLPVVPGYTVRELLETGGMGVRVPSGEDTPLRRRVALKLIRPGLDSLRVLARFEAERQALALIDHPHIAAVFGTGVSADRRPYWPMELVAGRTVTEHCDRAAAVDSVAARPVRARVRGRSTRAPERRHPPRSQALQRAGVELDGTGAKGD